MQDDTCLFRPTRTAWATLLLCQALCTGLPAAPALTATKDDGVAAAVKKPGGSTVTYTHTLSNATGAGITDATGVQFADPDIANATYASNTLKATPVAIDDVYLATVIANSSINTATSGFSVVTNDFAGYSAGSAVLASALTITSVTTPAHGAVTMTLSGAGVGQFVYTPTAGYVGADSFTYAISNAVTGGTSASRTGSVTLTVGGPLIWFVNPALAVNGTGILGNPFNNLAAAVPAIGANTNQRIFIYSGGAAQTTATPLNSGGWLVGQAAVGTTFESLMGGISYPSDTTTLRPTINNATKPALTRSGGNTVTLGENNVILGLAIGNTGSGYAISGTNINAGQIGNAVTSDVNLSSASSANGAFFLSGGNGAITINAPIVAAAGRSVNISSRTNGSVSFSKAISDTGTGINLTSNSGASVNFSGGLTLNTASNTAFNATGGGTITATQDNSSIINTLATTSGTALNVANTTIGASGITFRSITAGTASGTAGVGISLDTTGSSGGLTVTGNLTSVSGGTIQHKTGSDLSTTSGIGIYLNNTSNVSLSRMQLNDFDNFAIRGTNVNGFTLANSVINSTGGSSWNGTNDAGGFNEGSVSFAELTGSASISNTSISGGYADNVRVINTSGSLNRITFDTATIGGNHNGAASDGSLDRGNDGVTLEALTGAAVINATVTNSTFTSSRGDLFQLTNNGVAANDLIFTGNHLSNNYPRIGTGGGGVTLLTNGTGNLTLNLTGNDFRDSVGTAVLIVKSTGAATLAGTIANNTIGVAGVANSGSLEGSALKIQSAGGGTVTTLITGNAIRQYNNHGIELLTGGGASAQSGNFNATITGNTIANPGTNLATAAIAKNGIHLNGGTVLTDTYQIALDIGGAGALANSLSNSGAANDVLAGGEDIRFRQRQDTTVRLRGYTGTTTDIAAVQSYIIARNGGDGVPSAIASQQMTTASDGYFNTPGPGNPVTQPLIFATGGIEKSSIPVIPPTVSQAADRVNDALAAQPATREIQAAEMISQSQLDAVVAAAISRWEATGLTTEQLAKLRGMTFQMSTLDRNHLGEASEKLIRLDGNAGGHGWFVDVSDSSDSMFGNLKSATRRYTDESGLPAGRVDLLTTILHEMGHALGLPDTYSSQDRESIMFGQLTQGERRTPTTNQANGATPFVGDSSHFLTGGLNPITIGTLPPGKSVVITYEVVIDDPFALGATQLSSQATVQSTNAATILTDDPTVGGASDPTLTLLDRPDTTVASISRATASPTNTGSVSWSVTFANAISGLTGNNVLLVASALGGTPAITSVTPTGGAPATVWTVTASTGTGSGTLGLNLANDTSLSHDVTNAPFTGQIYTMDKTAPTIAIGAPSATSVNAGGTVTYPVTYADTNFNASTLATGDITLNATGGASGTLGVSGSGLTRDVTISSITGAGTLGISIAAGTASDSVGNTAPAAAPSTTFSVLSNNADLSGLTTTATGMTPAFAAGTISYSATVVNATTTTTVTATRADANATLQMQVNGGGFSSLTSGVESGALALTVGANSIDMRVTAQDGSTTKTYTTTVTRAAALPDLTINDVTVSEGNAGTQVLTFTVTRTGTTPSAVGFNFATADGTATTANADYVAATGTGTIPSGGATGTTTVSVTLNGDGVFENNESFFINLTAPTNATISDNQGIGTITNDDAAPTLAINDVSIIEGNSGTQNMVFTVTRTGLTALPASFTAATADGTATAPSDYLAALVGSTTIAAGGATATTTLTATINGDLVVEANETFVVNLTAPSNATISDNQGQGTITNDDTAGVVVTQSGGSTDVTEGGATDSYSLVLTSQPTSNVSVALNPGTQVTVATSPVVFTSANWNIAQTVTVTAVDDTAVEGPHSGTISHPVTSADIAYNALAVANVVASITDNDLPTLSINDVSIAEGNAGTQVLSFTVTRTGATPSAVGFHFATADGTATIADTDYVAATGNGSIPSGGATSTTTVSVTLNGDGVFENNESFFINLTAPTNATISDNQGIGTITNDDSAPTLAINDVSITEGNSGTQNMVFTVTRTGLTALPASFTAATADGTATAPSDYLAALVGSTTIAAGGATATTTLTATVNGDLVVEANETFVVNLTAPSNATISDNQGQGSITNDDFEANLAITKTDGVTTATPGGATTYTITASNAGPDPVVGATVADTLPASLTATWTAVGAGGGTVNSAGSGNINESVNLPVGGSVTFTVSASISAAATGSLSNTATVTTPGGTVDPVPANNSATDTDTLTPSANLAITKTDGVTTATPGTSVTYTITASNAGPSNVTGANVADTLPATISGATWTAVGAGGGTATAFGSGNINETVNLPVGGSVTYTVTAPISATATGSLSNTATVSSSAVDPAPGNNSATDSDTLTPQANLAITKTDGVTSAAPGTSVSYTITASNAGPSSVSTATVADTLPAIITGATWTATGAGGGTASAAGSGNINDTVNLPVGGSVTYTVTAPISAGATGALSNTATVSSSVTDPTPGNNSATDTDTLTPQANLAITKTDGVTTATPGGSVTYTIVASNAGPSNVIGATVADTLPASIVGATWTAVGAGGATGPASGSGNINTNTVSLPAGSSFTFTVTAPISSAATGTLSNTATVSSAVPDPTPGNNSATDSDTLTPSSDLTITVTDSPDPVIAGNNLSYTVNVTNNGPSAATTVALNDTLPAGTTFVSLTPTSGWSNTTPAIGANGQVSSSIASLAPGSASFTLVVKVGGAVASGTVVSNTASIGSATTDPTPGNNSSTTTTTVSVQADLAITKTDGVTSATPGSSVTYTITATNAGPSTVTGATVADTLPASIIGATWTGAGAGGGSGPASGSGNINANSVNLPAGGSFTFTVTAPISPTATGTLSNTATISSAVPDPTPGNNSATDSDTLTASADVAVSLTDSPDPVIAGNNLTYGITVTNNGPSAAASVTLSDTLPAGTTFVSLTSPAGWTNTTPAVGGTGLVSSTNTSLAPGPAAFILVVKIGNAVAQGTVLSDTASISALTTDPTPSNNSSTTTTTVNAQADLGVTKTDGVTTAVPGTSVTYTITAANAGPSDVIGATLADTLPGSISGATWTAVGAGGGTATAAGSGNLNDTVNLPAGGSVTYTVTAPVTASATGTLSNTATISSTVTDPTPGNNSATDTDTLIPQADLAVTITDSPDPVNAGGNLTYTITLTHNGPSTAVSPTVSLPLPASTTFVSATAAAGWTTTAPAVGGTGTVGFFIASLASGETVSFTVVAKVDLTVVNNSTLSATATTSSPTTDPTPGNNSATTTTLAKSGADLQIALADSPDPVIAGTNLTYTFQLANNGPLDAENVSITDTLPAGTTFVSLSTPLGWTPSTPLVGGTGLVTISKPLFANSGSASFTLVVKVGSAVTNGTILSNTAAVTSTTLDIIPGNNSATTTTTVSTQSNLLIDLTGTPDTAPQGSNVTYNITLRNFGPSDASAAAASFTLPAQMTFVSLSKPVGWMTAAPPVGSSGTVDFSAPLLANGAIVNFTVVAKVTTTTANGTLLTAIAAVGSATVDPAPSSNSDSVITAIGTLKPSAVQPVTTGIKVTTQTGLFDVNVKVTNTTPLPINGFRLRVNFDAYKAAYPSLRLENATSTSKKTNVYIDYPTAMAVGATVTVKMLFYTSTRTFPSPFVPALAVDLLATSQAAPLIGGGVQPSLSTMPNQAIQLAFPTITGRWYRVRYSADLVTWTDCQVPVQAVSTTTLWQDSGPPYTVTAPAVTPSRFYLVSEIAAP